MNYDDMRHKMQPSHWDHFRRMLGVNEVPEPVMVRYFQYKKYIDKIGSHISVMDLLRMAVDCGFDLETGLFGEVTQVTCKAKLDYIPTEVTETGPVDIIGTEKPVANPEDVTIWRLELDEAENTHTLDLDEAAEKRDQLKFEDVIVDGAETDEPTPPETTEPIEDGTTVQVYMGEELQDGIVKGHEVAEGGAITYKVEIDGETHELSEDDVDA